MTPALLYYQAALVGRSHRWLPPLLLYLVVVAIGTAGGDPLPSSLGWAAAAILPVTVWLTRVCVTAAPPAARHVVAAAAGPGRAHLAALLLACLSACVLAGACTLAVAMGTDRMSHEPGHDPSRGDIVVAGLGAQLVAILAGVAIGALGNRPVLRSAAWSVPLAAAVTLAALIVHGSPVADAVESMTGISGGDAAEPPATALAVTAIVFLLAVTLACRLAARGDDG